MLNRTCMFKITTIGLAAVVLVGLLIVMPATASAEEAEVETVEVTSLVDFNNLEQDRDRQWQRAMQSLMVFRFDLRETDDEVERLAGTFDELGCNEQKPKLENVARCEEVEDDLLEALVTSLRLREAWSRKLGDAYERRAKKNAELADLAAEFDTKMVCSRRESPPELTSILPLPFDFFGFRSGELESIRETQLRLLRSPRPWLSERTANISAATCLRKWAELDRALARSHRKRATAFDGLGKCFRIGGLRCGEALTRRRRRPARPSGCQWRLTERNGEVEAHCPEKTEP